MKRVLVRYRPVDFEKFGYHTALECGDDERAMQVCGLHLSTYADELRPDLGRLRSEIDELKTHARALDRHL